MPVRSPGTPRCGFTLIELLVVIAIIALLAAILFPVFSRARENGRRSSCQSNLKQLALGMQQYTQDFDEFYAPDYADNNDNGGMNHYSGAQMAACTGNGNCDEAWSQLMAKYTRTLALMQCPSEICKGNAANTTLADNTPGACRGYTDYWYNLRLSRRSLAVVRFPAQTLMFGDGHNSDAYQVGRCTDVDTNSLPSAVNMGVTGAQRHLEGGNYAFADGHVKWMKGQDADTPEDVWDEDLTSTSTPAFGSAVSCVP